MAPHRTKAGVWEGKRGRVEGRQMELKESYEHESSDEISKPNQASSHRADTKEGST